MAKIENASSPTYLRRSPFTVHRSPGDGSPFAVAGPVDCGDVSLATTEPKPKRRLAFGAQCQVSAASCLWRGLATTVNGERRAASDGFAAAEMDHDLTVFDPD